MATSEPSRQSRPGIVGGDIYTTRGVNKSKKQRKTSKQKLDDSKKELVLKSGEPNAW